jgi:hypothetical protein
MTAWAAFPDGSYPPGSGVRILERVSDGNRRQTRYRIRFLCCDDIGELSHQQIKDRIKEDAAQCRNCYRRSCTERAGAVARTRDVESAPQLLPIPPGWPPALVWDGYEIARKHGPRPDYN